jgi:hypothetical protein
MYLVREKFTKIKNGWKYILNSEIYILRVRAHRIYMILW